MESRTLSPIIVNDDDNEYVTVPTDEDHTEEKNTNIKLQQKISELEKLLEQSKLQHLEKDKILDELKEELQETRDEMNKSEAAHEEAVFENRNHQVTIYQLNQDMTLLDTELQTSQAALLHQLQINDQLQQQSSHSALHVHSLEQKLVDAQSQTNTLLQELSDLNQKYAKLSASLQHTQTKQLRLDLDEQKKQNTRLLLDLVTTKKRLEATLTEKAALERSKKGTSILDRNRLWSKAQEQNQIPSQTQPTSSGKKLRKGGTL